MSSDSATLARFEAARKMHAKTIRIYANKCAGQVRPMGVDDVEQELLVVLYDVCATYDPNKGARFRTLVQRSFNNKIISLIRHAQRQCRDGRLVSSLSEEAVRVVAEEALGRLAVGGSAEERALLRMELRSVLSLEAAMQMEQMVA